MLLIVNFFVRSYKRMPLRHSLINYLKQFFNEKKNVCPPFLFYFIFMLRLIIMFRVMIIFDPIF